MDKYFTSIELHEKTFVETPKETKPKKEEIYVNPYEHLENREKELNEIRNKMIVGKDVKQKFVKKASVAVEPPKIPDSNVAQTFLQKLFQ